MSSASFVRIEKLWGARVKARRKRLGFSQEQLAEQCEPPRRQTTISKVERGLLTPRDALKRSIAAALGTTVADLFPWEPDQALDPAVGE